MLLKKKTLALHLQNYAVQFSIIHDVFIERNKFQIFSNCLYTQLLISTK